LTARKKRVEAELKLEQAKLPALVKTRDDLAKLVVNLTDVFNKAKAALEKATADVVRVQGNRVTAENNVTAIQARVASLQKDVAKLANDISKIKK
jgi:chromosome segregation ATPase